MVLVAVVRAWGDVATVEVHEVSVVTSVPRSRPIAPTRATVADRATVHVAGIDEIIWV